MEHSEEVRAFLDEIEQVCRKHGMILSAEMYDGFQVWPFDERDLDRIRGAEACGFKTKLKGSKA